MSRDFDDVPVDAALDDLLHRALATGRISRDRRRAHLVQLGLPASPAEPGMAAATLDLPLGSARTISFSTDEQPRRTGRKWLELAAILLGCVVVAGFVAYMYSDRDDDERQVGATPAATATIARFASPTPAPASPVDTLFALGLPAEGTGGLLTALDATTGEDRYQLATGAAPGAALSLDGRRLYVTGVTTGAEEELAASDALTGVELWRTVSIPRIDESTHPAGALAVSTDGTRVYRYGLAGGAATVRVFSAEDGRLLGEIHRVTACDAQLHPSPNGRWLYVVCLGTGPIEALDADTFAPAGPLPQGGYTVGSAATRDGLRLFVLSTRTSAPSSAAIPWPIWGRIRCIACGSSRYHPTGSGSSMAWATSRWTEIRQRTRSGPGMSWRTGTDRSCRRVKHSPARPSRPGRTAARSLASATKAARSPRSAG
jgi:hypothetical protein